MQENGAGACPLCDAVDVTPTTLVGKDRMLGVPGVFRVVTCARCGAGRTLPVVREDALAAFYPSTYHQHSVTRGRLYGLAWKLGQRLRWRRTLARWPLALVAQARPGRALDIGCGRGDLGAALIERGWTVAGVDPSEAAVRVARERGLDARVGTVHSAGFDAEEFDAVIMLHALEHVVDPLADLEAARSLLRRGGMFVVEVPNFNCWQRRRMGSRWFHLDLPRHRTHFTAESLRDAAAKSGFTGIEVSDASDPGALLGTLQYRWFDRMVLDQGWKSAAWVVVARVLAPVTRMLDRVARGADFLHLAARRPS